MQKLTDDYVKQASGWKGPVGRDGHCHTHRWCCVLPNAMHQNCMLAPALNHTWLACIGACVAQVACISSGTVTASAACVPRGVLTCPSRLRLAPVMRRWMRWSRPRAMS